MAYKDTLELYEELIAGGASESQARIQAKQLGAISHILIKIDKDLVWMRIIGAAMIVTFMSAWFK